MPKYIKRSEGYYLAVSLIESEYENLKDMSAGDLWSYFTCLCYPGMETLTEEESNHLHKVTFI